MKVHYVTISRSWKFAKQKQLHEIATKKMHCTVERTSHKGEASQYTQTGFSFIKRKSGLPRPQTVNYSREPEK